MAATWKFATFANDNVSTSKEKFVEFMNLFVTYPDKNQREVIARGDNTIELYYYSAETPVLP